TQLGCLGTLAVDLLGVLSKAHQQDHIVWLDLGKASTHGGGLPHVVHLVAQLAGLNGGDRGGVACIDAHLAVHSREDQGLGGSNVELPLGGDDLQVEGIGFCHYTAPIFLALATTSSTLPTLLKATSGYLSSSPPRITSKERRVSSSFT